METRNKRLSNIESKFNLTTIAWLDYDSLVCEIDGNIVSIELSKNEFMQDKLVLKTTPINCEPIIVQITEKFATDELLETAFENAQKQLLELVKKSEGDTSNYYFPEWYQALDDDTKERILDGVIWFTYRENVLYGNDNTSGVSKFDGLHFSFDDGDLTFVAEAEKDILEFFNSYEDTYTESFCKIQDNLWCIEELYEYEEFRNYFKIKYGK